MDDTYRLIQMLNANKIGPGLSEKVLQRVFETNWPWFEQRLQAISIVEEETQRPRRGLDDKIDEILEVMRKLELKFLREEPQPRQSKATVSSEETEPRSKPKIFIGSSVEGLPVAEAIQLGLDIVAECTIWNQSAFDLGLTTFEGLVDIYREFDFAILVLTPDDILIKRGLEGVAPRDNLLFELGLFTGILGRARTFMVYSKDDGLKLPSDLAGATAATYSMRSDKNLHAALGPVCTRIKHAMGVK